MWPSFETGKVESLFPLWWSFQISVTLPFLYSERYNKMSWMLSCISKLLSVQRSFPRLCCFMCHLKKKKVNDFIGLHFLYGLLIKIWQGLLVTCSVFRRFQFPALVWKLAAPGYDFSLYFWFTSFDSETTKADASALSRANPRIQETTAKPSFTDLHFYLCVISLLLGP